MRDYRTKKELLALIKKRSITTADKYIAFVDRHPERYGDDAVIRKPRAVLTDADAFWDAYRYDTLIELGIAPEFRRGFV